MIRITIFIIFATLILMACRPPATAGELDKRVGRHVDSEAGIVCWVYVGVNSGGIDCLPISETSWGSSNKFVGVAHWTIVCHKVLVICHPCNCLLQ